MSGIKDLHRGRGGRGPGRPVVVLESGTPEDVEALVREAKSTLDEAVHLNNVALAKIGKLEKGADGKSAYEQYLEEGGDLSKTEWLASLHGRDADIAAANAATEAALDAASDARAAAADAIEAETTRQETFETNETARGAAASTAENDRQSAYQAAEAARNETAAAGEAQRAETFTQNEAGRGASVTAAQAAATAAATSAEAAEGKFTAIQEAINALDPSQSTSDAVAAEAITRAAADAQMAADIAALGPKIDQNTTNIANLQQEIDEITPIVIEGDVTNAPDEEDVTTDSNNLLKLKDRPTAVNQKGYKILRKGVALSTQITDTNTIYEVRYAFDLNGGTLTIPSGGTLKFAGGSITNGTISGTGCSLIDCKVSDFPSASNYFDFCYANDIRVILEGDVTCQDSCNIPDIDGCGHTVHLGTAARLTNTKTSVDIRNITFKRGDYCNKNSNANSGYTLSLTGSGSIILNNVIFVIVP